MMIDETLREILDLDEEKRNQRFHFGFPLLEATHA